MARLPELHDASVYATSELLGLKHNTHPPKEEKPPRWQGLLSK
jgi:hypothetical protein